MSNDDVSVNPSNNRAFEDVVDVYISRRQVLAGGLALAATAFFGNSAFAKPIKAVAANANPQQLFSATVRSPSRLLSKRWTSSRRRKAVC